MKFFISFFIGVLIMASSYTVYSGFILIDKVNAYNTYLDKRIHDAQEFIKWVNEENGTRDFIAYITKENIPLSQALGVE